MSLVGSVIMVAMVGRLLSAWFKGSLWFNESIFVGHFGLRAVEPVAFGHVLSCCKQELAVYLLGWDHVTTNVTISFCNSKSMHFVNRCDGLGFTYSLVRANLFCRDGIKCLLFTLCCGKKWLFVFVTKGARICFS